MTKTKVPIHVSTELVMPNSDERFRVSLDGAIEVEVDHDVKPKFVRDGVAIALIDFGKKLWKTDPAECLREV